MKTFSKTPGEIVQNVSCPVCGSELNAPHFDCKKFWFSRCSVCGLIFQNPRPAANVLLDRYDDEYFQYEIQEEKQFLQLMLKGLHDVGFFSLVGKCSEKSILDIGCATGILLSYLADLGCTVTGLEVCHSAALFGIQKRKIDIRINTLEQEKFPSNSFDFVHNSHVIEHVTNPVTFIDEIRRILKPGGYAIITTPNVTGLQARVYGAEWRSCIADHVTLFSRKNLRGLLRQNGFTIEKEKTWGGLAVGAGKPLLKKILDPLAKYFGFGDVMIFLARKL